MSSQTMVKIPSLHFHTGQLKQQPCPSSHRALTSVLRNLGAHRLQGEALKVGSRLPADLQRLPEIPTPLSSPLSVRLSFPSLAPPHRKHNFPLSLSFPLLLDNRGPFFILQAMATKCQQLGMWDAGPAGTHHRKRGLGRSRIRTGWTSPGQRDGVGALLVRRLKWVPSVPKLQASGGIWCEAGDGGARRRTEHVVGTAEGERAGWQQGGASVPGRKKWEFLRRTLKSWPEERSAYLSRLLLV